MSWNELIGFVGGALVNAGFIPQVIRVLKLKSAREISFPFTVLLILGTICWLVYGIVQDMPAVIFWNVILLVTSVTLLSVKLKYGKELKMK
jgi:MtN3 and saliva related transmembrane protein